MKKPFGAGLTLAKNSRGCYILDTVKGCSVVNTRQGGCYGECYAANIAKRYRLDFGSPVPRVFQGPEHRKEILRQIRRADMPFIRIGEMGDPSEDWGHTLQIVDAVRDVGKALVIITKHWKPIPEDLLPLLEGVHVNTSVSALDSPGEIAYRMGQYQRIAPFCDSVLRVVSCRFNRDNEEGRRRAGVQKALFQEPRAIDTVFRPSPTNRFVVDGVVLVESKQFLGTKMLASMDNPDAYFGRCETCPDMCGVPASKIARMQNEALGMLADLGDDDY